MEFFAKNIIPGEVIVQIVAFLIVFLVLKWLAWKPLLQGLQARRNRIKENFDEIEAAKKKIEALKAEYQAHIAKIDEEARQKIQEAIDEGRRIANEIQEKARAESQATFEKEKENLGLEIEKARITLRREIANLAILTTEKILQETLDESKQHQKIMELIDEAERDLAPPRKKP